jgi:uncharacterized protein YjiS (DUF1127 family)
MLQCTKRIAAMQNRPFILWAEMPIYASSKRLNTNGGISMNPIRAFRNWRMYNETVRELNRLNARQLSDLGISRADIEKIARKAL